MIKTTFDFNNGIDYTYDSNLIEFMDSKAVLKDLRPHKALFYTSFTSSMNEDWASDTLTSTAYGGPIIQSGMLDLTGNAEKYLAFAPATNISPITKGTYRFNVVPNYNTVPPSAYYFFAAGVDTTAQNLIALRHNSTGALELGLFDDSAVAIINYTSFGTWNPVAGTNYEIELNFDIDSGATRLFIDGLQFGNVISATSIARGTTIDDLYIGRNVQATSNADFKIDNFIVFDEVQHTANYTPNQSISTTIYSIANPSIKVNNFIPNDGLESFTVVNNVGTVKYILEKNNQKYFWNGSIWTESNGSYMQSNTAAEISANASTFVNERNNLSVYALLNSDGDTKTNLDSIEIGYKFNTEPVVINRCMVYAYVKDFRNVETSIPITVSLNKTTAKYKNNVILKNLSYTITVTNGYFSIDLIENENMEPGCFYVFTVNGVVYNKVVSNQVSSSFWDLEDAVINQVN